jgi:hypothetical protein
MYSDAHVSRGYWTRIDYFWWNEVFNYRNNICWITERDLVQTLEHIHDNLINYEAIELLILKNKRNLKIRNGIREMACLKMLQNVH